MTSGVRPLHQLAELVAAVAATTDEHAAITAAVERAAQAVHADHAAYLLGETTVHAVGAAGGATPVALAVDDDPPGRLVVARAGAPLTDDELELLGAMARMLGLTLPAVRRAEERSRLLASLRERQTLLERLSRIQRSISTRAPLDEVLEAIVDGARELLGDEVVGLRLLDPDDPDTLVLAATSGFDDDTLAVVRRSRVGRGVGGVAVREGRLVVTEDYEASLVALRGFAGQGLTAAMAAPVRDGDAVIGSLTVASQRPGRTYSESEREVLLAFAEHVSLAIADARLVDAVHQALHDPLTGLANRRLFQDRLEHALTGAEGDPSTVAVLFCDLDRFKLVNDSLGHAAGDELLVAVARRLRTCLRDGDLAARLGGDEFAVLLPDVQDPGDAERVARRIVDVLAAPFALGGREVVATASIGIALGTHDPVGMLRDADVAMYAAKASGRGGHVLFAPGMRAAAVERLDTEAELRRALARDDELEVHFQPIVALPDGRITGFEALARWRHPHRGLLGPAAFIPVAEETGLILPLGERILREACAHVAPWPGAPTVTVNLSGRQMQQPDLVRVVADALAAAELPPGRLVLEITETVLVQDTEAMVRRLDELRALGVRVALDDFGTGWSSLRYLDRFALDVLKIDRSFVAALGNRRQDAALARVVLQLGEALGLTVVAEGVERPDQVSALVALGCDAAQGFHFARPMAAPQAEALLAAPLIAAGG